MKFRDYNKVIAYLFNQLPMYQRIGKEAVKKDLTNIRRLCKHLDNPQKKFKSIHIAGTNGKGSTAHMLAAIFQTAGYKTGLYTSPHFKDFRERVKINGKLISKKSVIEFVNDNYDYFNKIKPSFFEISVALAFLSFASEEVDIAIIETGLGGRLDSTNILKPELSIITNISHDHQQFLGNTLVKIAGEKAGIIKYRVPVIISQRQWRVEKVFETVAKKKLSKLYFATDRFIAEQDNTSLDQVEYYVSDLKLDRQIRFKSDMTGSYQEGNVPGVFQAVDILRTRGWRLEEQAILKALGSVKVQTSFIGRWQVIGKNPLVICDSGHNPAGIKVLVEQLSRLKKSKLHMVLGVVKDKDPRKFVSLLPEDSLLYFARPDIPRGQDPEILKTIALDNGYKASVHISVQAGLQAARKKAGSNDVIFVGGSTFVVAEVI